MSDSEIRVLVVEDDRVDRMAVERSLAHSTHDFAVRSAGSCSEARGLLNSERFDAVLLDYQLGDGTGLELLAEYRRTPAIFVTGGGTEETAVHAMREGAYDYLIKDADLHYLTILPSAVANVVERRRTEESLARMEALLRETQRIAMVGGWEVNPETREATFTEELYRIAEINPEPGRQDVEQFLQLAVPESRERLDAKFEESLNGGGSFELELEAITGRGNSRWLRMIGHTHVEDDKAVRVSGFVQDITERKRLEDRVRQVQKLESLGALAGGIAHDFSNLLVTILGNADLALMDLPADSDVRSVIEEIRKTTLRASDLSSQMLAYSGRGAFVVRTVSLADVVADAAHLLDASVPSHVSVHYDLPAGIPQVDADVSQLRQMLSALVTNAVEAIGAETGTITISLRSVECDRAMLARTYLDEGLSEGHYVALLVSDDGCGMDEETQQRAFDPFFTTKFTGRGLGLGAVLGIVRGHKGGVVVNSRPGEGTTMTALFPAVRRPEGGGSARLDGWKGRGTILVADTEDISRDFAGAVLERFGFSVVATSTIDETTAALGDGSRISAALLDISMLRTGGHAIEAIRRGSPELPVIICSEYAAEEAAERFRGINARAFLQKPFEIRGLVAAIREVLGEDEE